MCLRLSPRLCPSVISRSCLSTVSALLNHGKRTNLTKLGVYIVFTVCGYSMLPWMLPDWLSALTLYHDNIEYILGDL